MLNIDKVYLRFATTTRTHFQGQKAKRVTDPISCTTTLMLAGKPAETKRADKLPRREEWRPVEGYEGLYEVSNRGRIKSVAKTIKRGGRVVCHQASDRILKPKHKPNGYLQAWLYDRDGIVKAHYVHRLVAQAFIQNPYGLPQVNHRDGNRENNRLSNLEWASGSYNVSMAKHGKKEKHTRKIVIQLDEKGKLLGAFNTIAEAARALKVSETAVRYYIEGKLGKKCGYRLKYMNIDYPVNM